MIKYIYYNFVVSNIYIKIYLEMYVVDVEFEDFKLFDFSNYFSILVFLGIAGGMCLAMVIGSYMFSPKNPDDEKLSTYECGFEPFSGSLVKYHVHFYLVSILFILFDLEITFLFPWAVSFQAQGDLGFYSMIIFLIVLTVGFIYEWKKGALEW